MPQPSGTGGNMGYPASVDTGQVQPSIINNEVAAYVGTSGLLVANTVYLFAFELQTQVTIIKARWRMAATTTGTTNMGIYTQNGAASALVSGSDTGAQTNAASADNNFTYATPILLSPGQYFMALAPSNSTDTYLTRGAAGTQGTSRARLATNALSAGVLPATTGTLLAAGTTPSMALIDSGGLP